MFGFPRPQVKLGPDGMSDYSREMHRQWARRDAVMAKINEALSEKTGIPADLIPHMAPEYVTLAAVLGVKVDCE